MIVNGKWTDHPVANDSRGAFVRPEAVFRSWVTPDGGPGPTGSGGFKAEAGRYHLYVALACPWASRTLIARKLKRLDDVVTISVVEPEQSEQGWRFGEHPGDTVNGATYLHEIYTRAVPDFTGRTTVPVLWDKGTKTIVNNESADIVRILNSGFGQLADAKVNLYPEALRTEIDDWNDRIYPRLNNGVYRAGFATTQEAYEEAFKSVFGMLNELAPHLAIRRFLVGDRLTEADIRLFVTLIRFDAAYYGVFKCNLRRIVDYPALSAYVRRLLDIPSIRETVSIDHIKRGYYSIRAINPTGIVPLGPDLRSLGIS
ncbi:MAG: glutathione S-transferase family protein [Xanthobacteraceae bacterium]